MDGQERQADLEEAKAVGQLKARVSGEVVEGEAGRRDKA